MDRNTNRTGPPTGNGGSAGGRPPRPPPSQLRQQRPPLNASIASRARPSSSAPRTRPPSGSQSTQLLGAPARPPTGNHAMQMQLPSSNRNRSMQMQPSSAATVNDSRQRRPSATGRQQQPSTQTNPPSAQTNRSSVQRPQRPASGHPSSTSFIRRGSLAPAPPMQQYGGYPYRYGHQQYHPNMMHQFAGQSLAMAQQHDSRRVSNDSMLPTPSSARIQRQMIGIGQMPIGGEQLGLGNVNNFSMDDDGLTEAGFNDAFLDNEDSSSSTARNRPSTHAAARSALPGGGTGTSTSIARTSGAAAAAVAAAPRTSLGPAAAARTASTRGQGDTGPPSSDLDVSTRSSDSSSSESGTRGRRRRGKTAGMPDSDSSDEEEARDLVASHSRRGGEPSRARDLVAAHSGRGGEPSPRSEDEPLLDGNAKEHFIASNNDPKILFAMGVGLTNENGTPFIAFDDQAFKDAKSLKQMKPLNKHLVEEQIRRREFSEQNVRVNSQTAREQLMQWLKGNPIDDDTDVAFLKREILILRGKALAVVRSRTAGSNTASAVLRCTGPAPYMRIIHAIVDVPATKSAFIASFNTMTQPQVDGRANPETARPDPWPMVEATYNDPSFNPKSTIYADSHPDLAKEIDLSYNAIVPRMGEMTGEKAKDKFNEMKNQASIVVARSEGSGSGDGTLRQDQADFAREDGDVPVGGTGGLAGNLISFGFHILYFINQVTENGIRQHSVQTLEQGFRLDGGNDAPSVRDNRRSRGRSSNEDRPGAEYVHGMVESNRHMGVINETLLQRHLMEKSAEIRACKKSIRRVERDRDATDSDVEVEKDELKDLENERDAIQQRLEAVQAKNAEASSNAQLELGQQQQQRRRRNNRRSTNNDGDEDDESWEIQDPVTGEIVQGVM